MSIRVAQILQWPQGLSQFGGSTPRAADNLPDASHSLRVRAYHGYSAYVVQDVFGSNRLCANTRLGESDVLRYVLVQMMADHEHLLPGEAGMSNHQTHDQLH